MKKYIILAPVNGFLHGLTKTGTMISALNLRRAIPDLKPFDCLSHALQYMQTEKDAGSKWDLATIEVDIQPDL